MKNGTKNIIIFFSCLNFLSARVLASESNKAPEFVFDILGDQNNSLSNEQKGEFRSFIKKEYSCEEEDLVRVFDKEHKISSSQLFLQDPGYSFHVASPAHHMALIYGMLGGLKVFDAGTGNMYWAFLLAAQGNEVEAVDIFFSSTLNNKMNTLKKAGLYFIYDKRITSVLSEFIYRLDRNFKNEILYDIITSFDSTHMLTPAEVNQFFPLAFKALKEGGLFVGRANSICQHSPKTCKGLDFEEDGKPVCLEQLIAICAENQAKDSAFPGYLAITKPALFMANYRTIQIYELINDPRCKFKIFRPEGEYKPNVIYPSTELNRATVNNIIDFNAQLVLHSFTVKAIKDALIRAGFKDYFVAYYDEERREIYNENDNDPEAKYSKMLTVIFWAFK